MPSRRYSDDDYAGLISLMEGGQVGSHNWEVGKTKLTLANMEVQGEASRQLVISTDELVKATKQLGKFTLALVWVTVVLVLVTLLVAFKAHGSP